jgi:hypothetical protein
MDLRDATLMFLAETAGYSQVARSAYDQLLRDGDIDYGVLGDLVDEASGKGALRAMRQKYSPSAFDAIIMPVLQEVGLRKPIRSSRPGWQPKPGEDPLGG